MRILIILSSHEMDSKSIPNIVILNDYMKQLGHTFDYAGISSTDDFINYEHIIQFKYKMINPKHQFSKICDFISTHDLNYDWYVKIRPDVKLLDTLHFNTYSETAINARARMYIGPKKIKYGASIGGEGGYKDIDGIIYSPEEELVILDDMVYIFHNNVIINEAFAIFQTNERENEDFHTKVWKSRDIELNVIGINMDFTRYSTGMSGDI